MIGTKLKKLRESRRLTVQQFCDQIGINPNTYKKYERDERDVSTDMLITFADFYHVPADYLLSRSPDIDPLANLPAEEREKAVLKEYLALDRTTRAKIMSALEAAFYSMRAYPSEEDETIAETAEIIQTILVRYYPDAVSAGTGIILGDDYPERLSFEATEEAKKADFAVTVHGDSMIPDFTDGDIVFVREDNVEIGEVGVFRQNGEGYIKERGERELISRNPEYPPIPMSDDCFAVGKVIGKGTIIE